MKISIEKTTVLISLFAVIVSLVTAFISQNSNRELEEKKLEIELFSKAIVVNDKEATLNNLRFLLKMGVLSNERELAIRSLTDSLYISGNERYTTASDTVGFVDFYLRNNQKDKAYYFQMVRGALIHINGLDTLRPFEITAFSDYEGKFEMSYPIIYGGTNVHARIVKDGYKTKEFDFILPKYDNVSSDLYRQEIVLEVAQ